MKRLLVAVTLLSAIYVQDTSAQTRRINISGKIISFEESFPIEGVSIVVKGSKNATGTQADGTFNLSILPADKILVISLDGYETQEVKITGARQYDIVLRRKNSITQSPRRRPLMYGYKKHPQRHYSSTLYYLVSA